MKAAGIVTGLLPLDQLPPYLQLAFHIQATNDQVAGCPSPTLFGYLIPSDIRVASKKRLELHMIG